MVRPLVVTGAGGRIGRLLRQLWPGPALWLSRAEWDVLGVPPELPQGAVILDLAGVTRGDFTLNPRLAAGIGRAAQTAGAKVIHLSSAAVYPGGPGEMDEATPIAPPSAYGASKQQAEGILRHLCPDATILRLCNVAGIDAVLGPRPIGQAILLDPVPGGIRGPVRSYIGPVVLADALWALCCAGAQDAPLPLVMNLCQPGEIAMAELMDAAGLEWTFGPPRPGVVARVVLSTARQSAHLVLPTATAETLLADLRHLGGWP